MDEPASSSSRTPRLTQSVSEPTLSKVNSSTTAVFDVGVSVTRFTRQITHNKQKEVSDEGERPASVTHCKDLETQGGVPKGTSALPKLVNAVKEGARTLPRISPELPKLRHGRFTGDERLCFRRKPFPSHGCTQKAEQFWRTTGCLRMAMSESGLHMIPRSKGDFWCCPEFTQQLRPEKRGTTSDPLRRRGALFVGSDSAGQANVLPAESLTARILDEIYPAELLPHKGSEGNIASLANYSAQERLKVVADTGKAHKEHKDVKKQPAEERSPNVQADRTGARDTKNSMPAEDPKKKMQDFRLKILDKYSTIGEAFDGLDCDMSKSLTSKEWNNTLYNAGLASYREARALFDLVDTDKSGTITMTEFYVALESVTPIRTMEDFRKRLLAGGFSTMLSAIAAMDNNGEISDKRLSFQEFSHILSRVALTDDDENTSVFLQVRDSNSPDNTVSISELATALAVVSPCLLIEEIRERFIAKFGTIGNAWDRIDIDKSGDCNAVEFWRQAKKNLNLTLEEAQKVFRWIDSDSSGVISKGEFVGAVGLSSSSLQLEDFRRKVRQRFRSIEGAFLEAFANSGPGGGLDNTLQLSHAEFSSILESIEVSTKDTKRLFDLVDADKSGTLTLREFFRGIEIFAPSSLLEGMQLLILRRQKNGVASDAFKQIRIGRNEPMDLNAFRTLLEENNLIKGVKVAPLFDLLDVRSDGCVTLGELIAALQCVQSGTAVKLSPEEQDLQAKLKVRGDLAPFHRSIADTKLQVRAGLAGRTPEDRRRPRKSEPTNVEHSDLLHAEAEEKVIAAGGGAELLCFEDRFSTIPQQSFAKLKKDMDMCTNKTDSHKSLVQNLQTYFGQANRMLTTHAPLFQTSYSRSKHHEMTKAHKAVMRKGMKGQGTV